MSKVILTGLDGSPREAAVLRRALLLAEREEASLHLCRAMSIPVSVPTLLWTMQGDDFEAFLVEHGRNDLVKLAANVAPDRLGGVYSRLGQPADVLCDLARELDADVLVIGTHGHSRIDHVLGTTAAKVVNRAPCSVFVVRDRNDP